MTMMTDVRDGRERNVRTQSSLGLSDYRFTVLLESHQTPQRAVNEYQALMEAKPGDEPWESLFDVDELRDSVMGAWQRLTDEDQFVLGARIIERLSFDAIGARLSVSKSQARRMVIAAKKRLESLLLTEETVRDHIGSEQSWNMAARKALLDLSPSGGEIDAICEWGITANMRDARKLLNKQPLDEKALVNALTNIGTCAAAILANKGAWDVALMERLLCSKQKDYGCENINAFGLHGVVIRLSDKVARWEHLMSKGATPLNETLEDTLRDMAGYAAVALLLQRGEFELPLEDL